MNNPQIITLILTAALFVSCTSDMSKFDAIVSALENEEMKILNAEHG